MAVLKPKVSFIVPSRLSRYLIFTINNLLDSSDMRYEVVLSLNNGTTYVPKNISRIKDRRLRIFTSKSNLSMTQNWFKGLLNSRGEWICFIGADDGVVSSQISKFIDILEEQGNLDVVISHNIAFTYSSPNKEAWANVPTSAPTGRRMVVRWPTQLSALFPQFNYDMPQPYGKALVKKKLLEPLLENAKKVSVSYPDIYLGNYVAVASKKGLYVDEVFTIRGSSYDSIGSQIFGNRKLSKSANEIMKDFNKISYLYPLQSFFGITCRPAMALDNFNLVINNKWFSNKTINSIWCQFTCLDSIHHSKTRLREFIASFFYKIGLILRKIWYWKNFGFSIPKDSKVIMPKDMDIYEFSKLQSETKS